jgi:hypothetical protein
MPWWPNPSGGAPIQAPTNPNPAGGSYGYYSDPGYTGPPPSTGGGGGSTSSPGTVQAPATVQPTAGADAYSKAINQAVAALNSSDLKAFNEQVREWDKIFGFNTEQFQEGVRQYNQNFGVTQAGLTGTYQGAPTQQALNQYANFLGTYGAGGPQTLQAQNQFFNQNLATASLAAGLQANPFRQQQVLGQAQRIMAGQPTASFQAPNMVAGVGTAGGNTQGGMGYLQQMIDDIKNPVANQTTADQFIASTPTPNKLDSTSFLRSAPSTQNLVLQAMQEKYGIDPKDAVTQIQNTLPQFQSPTIVGSVKR